MTHGSGPLSSPVYQILLSLSDRVLHGYAILRDVEERTGGEVRLAAGTLYAAIARLERDGLVEEVPESADAPGEDPRRRYYRITETGLAALREEAARLRRFLRMAEDKQIVSGSTAGADGS